MNFYMATRIHDRRSSEIEKTASPSLPCALCGKSSTRLHSVDGYWIRECNSCAHQFAELDCQQDQQEHVQRVYSDDYFFGGGAGYNDYLSEERLLVARGRWYARLMSRYCRPGTVLDIGAASGFTLQGLSEAGWQGFGIEPNVGLAEYATNRLGIPVEACSLESWTTDRCYDLVTMLQVLPHFLDPKKAIRQSADLLHPGGHLLIEAWDRKSWTARVFGKHWHEYSPPSVLHWFSQEGVVRMAANLGFEFVAQGRPSKWIDAGHAKSLLASRPPLSLASRLLLWAAQIIPDRVAIPYPSEDLFWLLLRRL
jgi:2-polyprenyl-3-methyl-5-hydroxy-6-metoxy-1,4-benzoquinol methylase